MEEVWISATALEHGLIVITRNLRHFRRIPPADRGFMVVVILVCTA